MIAALKFFALLFLLPGLGRPDRLGHDLYALPCHHAEVASDGAASFRSARHSRHHDLPDAGKNRNLNLIEYTSVGVFLTGLVVA